MQIISGRIDFPIKSGTGPQEISTEVTLAQLFNQVTVMLTGFEVQYNAVDHHLGQVDIRLEVMPTDDHHVRVTAFLGLRDWSHNIDSSPWDDPYLGNIRFAVIAEKE